MQQIFCVRAFCGHSAKGNLHKVIILSSPLATAKDSLRALSQESSEIIIGLCVGEQLEACFYHHGHPIKRCGSGNLACAFVLNSLDLIENTPLLTPAGSVTLLKGEHGYGYQVTCDLPYHNAPPDAVEGRCFNKRPERVIWCGKEDDYAILIYPDAATIRTLVPDCATICQSTRRAIIVTAPADDNRYHYTVRYFAPQWGNTEDSATGSANAVLAPYWFDRLNTSEISGFQASPQGGIIKVKTNPQGCRPLADHAALGNMPISIWGRCESVWRHH